MEENKEMEEEIEKDKLNEEYIIDFTTSSAISKVGIKFLILYIPIFWLSGFIVGITWYQYIWFAVKLNPWLWIIQIIFLPLSLVGSVFLFIISCVFFSKLFLIMINLIHKPREGVFLAEWGDQDFEFWCLRTEIKKLVLWLMNNCPVPLVDILGFRWFGLKLDFSSHLYDSWCDLEYVKFGRNVLVGQGVALMGSMVVGKYLIIKKIYLDDYVVLGGHSTVAPGTIAGKESFLGGFAVTIFNQILEPGWVYHGIPPRKLKPNKYAEMRRNILIKKEVDEEKKYEIEHEVNIDEDKKDLV
ncbi:MAG: hypothetical protein ACFFBP_04155 [Promethearchaeota archaeon]